MTVQILYKTQNRVYKFENIGKVSNMNSDFKNDFLVITDINGNQKAIPIIDIKCWEVKP